MIKKATQLTVYLPNQPGSAAKLFSALAKTNLLAVSVVDSVDSCAVRLVPANAVQAQRLLNKAGICSTIQNVLVADMPNLPGALQKVCRKLARAKVNIDYLYASVGPQTAEARVVLRVSSIAHAIKALK